MSLIYLLVLAVLVVIGVIRTKEFRATALQKLSGKWGKAVFIALAYLAISILLGFVSGPWGESSAIKLLLTIAIYVIEVPLAYGLSTSFIKLYKGEDIKAFDFLSYGFSNFGRSWAVALRTFLKMLLPFILYIVGIFFIAGSLVFSSASLISGASSSGAFIFVILGFILIIVSMIWLIIRSFSYAMAEYIAIDSPELSTKDAVNHSKEIMIGNRAKLFWLGLSFGGWAILAALTFGIGCLWLVPYMQFASIAFYYFVAGKTDNNVTLEETSNPIENSTEI